MAATVRDLMERYNVTRPGIIQFVKAHLDEINADGEHAVITKGEWNFDKEAVKKIDELRKYGAVEIVQGIENDKIMVLREENERLLRENSAMKDKIIEMSGTVSNLYQQVTENQKLAIAAKISEEQRKKAEEENTNLKVEKATLAQKLEQAQKNQDKIKSANDRMQQRLVQVEADLKAARDKQAQLAAEKEEKEQRIDKLRRRGFFARLFNRDE